MNYDPHLLQNFAQANKDKRLVLDQLGTEIQRIKSRAAYAEKLAKIQEKMDAK